MRCFIYLLYILIHGGACVAVPALLFMVTLSGEVIDKDTRSSERTDYPHYASEVALAFGSRVVGLELAKMIVDAWLGAQYEGGRHQQRVEAITAIEQRRN
ncbi:RpiB/LacA/LacB family sugar-phosphate isomerase [Escherichia coli]|uniref:RpiB/LacA/LacB family sugar-phosphate isomerase n=1 Tax=Escherichia coli TaxID=562 RepID=UPI0037DCF403